MRANQIYYNISVAHLAIRLLTLLSLCSCSRTAKWSFADGRFLGEVLEAGAGYVNSDKCM